MNKPEVDFFINQTPYSISFTCPHCDYEVEVLWKYLNIPEYWGDDWGYVECPFCGKEVKLGEYDI